MASDIDSTAFALPCAISVDAVKVGPSTGWLMQLRSASRRQQVHTADDAVKVGTSTGWLMQLKSASRRVGFCVTSIRDGP